MGTNCAAKVEALFFWCHEKDFMLFLSYDKQADIIAAFYTTFRYLDDISAINSIYFDNMVCQIYPSEFQLNKIITFDTEVSFLDLRLSISNDIVSTKTYDKRNDLDLEIVNFPFLYRYVPLPTSKEIQQLNPSEPDHRHDIRHQNYQGKNFLNLYINRYKTLAPKALPPERFKSDMEFRYQMIVQLYQR